MRFVGYVVAIVAWGVLSGAAGQALAEEIDPRWIAGKWVTDNVARGAVEQWELVFHSDGTFQGSITGSRTLTMSGVWKLEGDAVRLEGQRTSGNRSRRPATVGDPFNDRFRRDGDILK